MRTRIGQLVIALAGILALLLVIGYLPMPSRTYFWDRAYDTGHILVFGLVTVLILKGANSLFADRFLAKQYVAAMSLAFSVGVAVEVWQENHHRSAEWIDALNDLIGILAFSAVCAIFDRRIKEPRLGVSKRTVLASFAIGVVVIGIMPLLNTAWQYSARTHILPRLIDFRRPWEGIFFHVQSADFDVIDSPISWPEDAVAAHLVVGRLTAHPGRYPGFVMHEPHPDWRGYHYLELELFYVESEARQFVLRVHDAQQSNYEKDRFRLKVLLQPGYQKIAVPLSDIQSAPEGRQMDLSQIAGFSLFTADLDKSVELLIGDVRLAR